MSSKFYKDILFPDAVEITLTSGVASAGRIQNNLQIGPSRAGHLIDEMESLGIIGPSQGSRPRAILMTLDEWYESKHTFVHLEEPARPAAPTQATGAAMYCRHCGKQLSVSSKFCDGCGKPTDGPVVEPKKKKKKHPFIGFLFIVLALLVMIVSCDDGSGEESKKTESGSSPVVATKPAPKVYGIGDPLEMDGIRVTLNDVYEVGAGMFAEPAKGNVFVIFDLTIENHTDDDLTVSSIMCFKAYFDEFAAEYSLGALSADDSGMQLDGTLTPGKKLKGVIGYEAPEKWKEAEITFEPEFFNSNVFTFTYTR